MQAIHSYLNELKIGRKQVYENLAIFSLLSNYVADIDYLTLDEAMEQALIEITEIDTEGSVPELKVRNKHSKMILIIDGEELIGAKQNRIVNTTILVPPKSNVVIPVSCVEQGRWSYESKYFRSGRRVMPGELRAMKAQQVNRNLKTYCKFRADQGAIWEGIEQRSRRRSVESSTGAMAAIYEKEKHTLEDYTSKFNLILGQVGAIFMINGKVAGLDSFGRPDTFEKVFDKLIQSYALDALELRGQAIKNRALKSEVTNFINHAKGANLEFHPSIGEGTDCRMESEKVTGFALVVDERIIHVSIFRKTETPGSKRGNSRMQRFSQRRENRLV